MGANTGIGLPGDGGGGTDLSGLSAWKVTGIVTPSLKSGFRKVTALYEFG